jgi:predicted permease
VLNDLRYAFRQLLKTPGFSVVALATLALGIGVNSALFNVVNSVLFRPPGYSDPATLVDVYETSPGFRYATTSYPNYLDVRDQNRSFSGVALYQLQSLGFSRGEGTKSVWAEVVSGNYFDVLGVPSWLGRTFDARQDDVVGAPPVVVVSHPFWERELGADPGAVGAAVRLNGAPFQVIGVAPPEFRGMIRGLVAQVWIPAASSARVFPGTSFLVERSNHNSFMRARLKPGVTVAQAAADLATIARRLGETYPASNAGRELIAVPTSSVTLNPSIDGQVTGASLGLLAVPAMVLLIACANLATLFLTRTTARRRELAVRSALGAGRGRVVRELMAESLLLAGAGGLLGLVVCLWLSGLLVSFQPPIPIPLTLDVQVDWRVVTFTAVVTIATGVLFGLAPALRASRTDLTHDLREGARGSASRSRLRAVLVAAQLAVSVVLLVGSGLLIRGLGGAARIELGFDPLGAATLLFDPGQQGYDDAKALQLVETLLGRVRSLPGVVAASYTSRPPLNLNVSSNEIVAEGNDPGPGKYPEIQRATVGPDYLAAIGGRLAAGREFTDRDRADQPPVVMVNEAATKLLWPQGSALGKRLATHSSRGAGPWREVVGIVADIKVVTIGERPTPQIFYPLYQQFESQVNLIARTTGDPAATGAALRQALRELDPALPIIASGVLVDQVSTALFPVRFAAILLVVLGLAGLVIAAIGLYGMIAQGVAARTRELGIRLALGAEPAVIRGLVLRDGLRLTAFGLGIGVVLAALTSRVLEAWLYGVSALDPLAFSVAPAVLLMVAAVASLVPARRATRVDPVEALRAE